MFKFNILVIITLCFVIEVIHLIWIDWNFLPQNNCQNWSFFNWDKSLLYRTEIAVYVYKLSRLWHESFEVNQRVLELSDDTNKVFSRTG